MKQSTDKATILISDDRLGEIVRALLLNPEAAGEDMSPDTYKMFRGAIAEVVADYCGGDVLYPDDGIAITLNECSPPDGGIWVAELPKQMPAEVSGMVSSLLGNVARDDDGSFMITQRAIGSLNQLSATVDGGAWLLNGQLEPGIDVDGFPRASWDESKEYYEWVDEQLQAKYDSIRSEFGFNQQYSSLEPFL